MSTITVNDPSYDKIYTVEAWQDNNRTLKLIQGEGVVIPQDADEDTEIEVSNIKAPRFQLKDKRGAIDLSSINSTDINWAVKRPGSGGEDLLACNIVTATDGIIEIPITASVTEYAGDAYGEIRVTTENGVIKFLGINACISDGVSDDAVTHSTQFGALFAALQKVVQLSNNTELIAAMDKLTNGYLPDGTNPVASGQLKEFLEGNFQDYLKERFVTEEDGETITKSDGTITGITWKQGGMYAATGKEYSSSSRIISDFIPVSEGQIMVDCSDTANLNVFLFATDDTTTDSENVRLSIIGGITTFPRNINIDSSTHYIRIMDSSTGNISSGKNITIIDMSAPLLSNQLTEFRYSNALIDSRGEFDLIDRSSESENPLPVMPMNTYVYADIANFRESLDASFSSHIIEENDGSYFLVRKVRLYDYSKAFMLFFDGTSSQYKCYVSSGGAATWTKCATEDYAFAKSPTVLTSDDSIDSVIDSGFYVWVSGENSIPTGLPDEMANDIGNMVIYGAANYRKTQIVTRQTTGDMYIRTLKQTITADTAPQWYPWKKLVNEDRLSKVYGVINPTWIQGAISVGQNDPYVAPGYFIENSPIMISTDYITVSPKERIFVSAPENSETRVFYYALDENQAYSLILNTAYDYQYSGYFTFIVPDDVAAIRIRAAKKSRPTIDTSYGKEYVIHRNRDLSVMYDCSASASYVTEEANRVADLVRTLHNNISYRQSQNDDPTSKKPFTFISISDLHFLYDGGSNNSEVERALNDMANGVNEIANQVEVDYLFGLGDYIYRLVTDRSKDVFTIYDSFDDGKQEMIAAMKIVSRAFDNINIPQIRLVGNHDPNSIELGTGARAFSMSDLNYFITRHNDDFVVDESNPEGCYGYVDIENKKLRVVALNTSDFSDPYIKTSDTAIISGKTYYTRSGSEPNYKYEPVENPVVDNIGSYYEINPGLAGHGNTYYGTSAAQRAWITNTLNDDELTSGWSILVISHIPPGSTDASTTQSLWCGSDSNNIAAIINNALTRHFKTTDTDIVSGKTYYIRSGTAPDYEYTVVSNPVTTDLDKYYEIGTLKLLPIISGHNHTYGFSSVNIAETSGAKKWSQLVNVLTPNALPDRTSSFLSAQYDKRPLSKESTAFCVNTYDFDTDTLYSYHYGAGIDRILHYGSQEIGSGLTLTLTVLDPNDVEWAIAPNYDNILTVNNGVITPNGSDGYALVYAKDSDGNIEVFNVKHISTE